MGTRLAFYAGMNLTDQLDRLAAWEASPYPVVSLYLNTQPNQHGRDQHHAFVRKELKARGGTYSSGSAERESLDRDLDRIGKFLDSELQPSANGVAIFACSAGELFEAIQLPAPIDQHALYIADRPHLYPLARLESQHPRYAALLADTNTARIMVFAAGGLEDERSINGVKTRRTTQGGWSQARYQRHVENFHLQHVKEVIDALDEIVRRDDIQHVLLSCDEVALPLFREQMPKHLADKIVDTVKLDTQAPVGEVLNVTRDAMQTLNARTDDEKVDAAIGAYRAGGLGVVGVEDTLDALIKGQVDELLISASLREMQNLPDPAEIAAMADDAALADPPVEPMTAGEAAEADIQVVRLADELIAKAKQTAAKITFIENSDALAAYGGVAALLRFRI
jgi:peptide chain release factor subunit 1